MKTYGYPAPDGRINGVMNADAPPAADWYELPDHAGPDEFYISNGTVVAFTTEERARLRARPPFCVWDQTARDWIDNRTLADLKTAKWNEIKAAAKKAANGGFTAAGHTWDSDMESQQAIVLTLQDMATAGGPTTVQWMTADGEVLTLTAAQLRTLARATRNHVQDQREKAATLRQQIQAASTAAEVDAVAW